MISSKRGAPTLGIHDEPFNNNVLSLCKGGEVSHTPGPWTIHTDRDNQDVAVGDPDFYASIMGDDWHVARVWQIEDSADNAKLIAAAPDLLGACLAAEKWLDGWASAEPYIDVIRAAIAKAGGSVAQRFSEPK
jgi:hypothetical protein